jgi:hypothetical protein
MRRLAIAALLVTAALGMATCGGGGGGGDDGGSASGGRTTFTGNLAAEAALAVAAQTGDVQVCVENTTFCTLVDANGVFTLAADVGGDVTLVFSGPDFVARVTLTDIPLGATVRLRNIHCSTVTGTCEPEDLEIEDDETRGPIRCQQGPIHIVHAGELVIAGNGEDCIRTEGQCVVTIDADRIVLEDCQACVRTAGGSDVTLTAGTGGIVCTASEDGIRAAGNSAVHLSAAGTGDVDIQAGEDGILSEGTALVEIGGDQCRIEGGESALHTNGNAEIDSSGCAAVDLIGGEDGNDDNDDDDHGNGNGNGNGHGHGNDDDEDD